MAYSQSLAARVRDRIARRQGITEKRMFGGVGFLLDEHMLVGIWQDSLVVRVGPDQYADALRQPSAGEFSITGRPMTGWVLVDPDGVDGDRQLADWIERAWQFVSRLPPKDKALPGLKKSGKKRDQPGQPESVEQSVHTESTEKKRTPRKTAARTSPPKKSTGPKPGIRKHDATG